MGTTRLAALVNLRKSILGIPTAMRHQHYAKILLTRLVVTRILSC